MPPDRNVPRRPKRARPNRAVTPATNAISRQFGPRRSEAADPGEAYETGRGAVAGWWAAGDCGADGAGVPVPGGVAVVDISQTSVERSRRRAAGRAGGGITDD